MSVASPAGRGAARQASNLCRSARLQVSNTHNFCSSLKQERIRHASSSRIPGSSRPSRVNPRPIHNDKHSHAHPRREAEITKEGEGDAKVGSRSFMETNGASRGDEMNAGLERVETEVATPLGLESILGQDTLVVTRQVEMMNIFLGFEQANRYAINTTQGEPVGYLAETEKGLLGGSIQRQVLKTHRPFEAQIMDTNGNVVLVIKRPFTFINSTVSIFSIDPETREEVLVGEIHQVWHLYRRKYELYINRGGKRGQEDLEQFADIDEGLWAWDFVLKNDKGRPLGAISRNFRGFGREIFTDTGQYVLTFDPSTPTSDLRLEDVKKSESPTLANSTAGRELIESGPSRQLTIQERVVALATAISADFDYFSRHSQNSAGGFLPYWMMSGGGSGSSEPKPEAEGSTSPTTQGQDSSGVQAPPPAPGSTGTGADAGTAAGFGMFGGGRDGSDVQTGPSSSSPSTYDGSEFESSAPPADDFGQGQEDVWGKDDPWAEQTGMGESTSSWDWSDVFGGGD
ncbi:hypothetical protein CBS101457_001378 [Exobasidium rhododendri]|nr:hypothetical protein CBS101457_001378 [Exobasidium rhododendri]